MALPYTLISREYGAEKINAVVNHPGVRPWVGGNGPIDLSQTVADQRNVLLMGRGGGFVLIQLEPGIYEAHSQFLPGHRGAHVIAAAKEASRYMFTRTDCVEIVTKVPTGNVGAAALAKALHWRLQFEREHAWPASTGMVGCKYFSKTIMDWAGEAEELEQTGSWFHGKLEAAKIEAGSQMPVHDDDTAHDRYVGATVEMIAAGQIAKGINFYNRWARFSGYGPVSGIATNPIVIDIGDAILAVRGEDFEVLLCR
jgi:hypothetical protein